VKRKSLYILIVVAVIVLGVIYAAQTNFLNEIISDKEEYSTGKPVKVVPGDNGIYMSPIWSPDGNYISYTSVNYKGIWIKNLKTNDIKQITDEDAAGFGFEWSPNSEAILSRVAKYEGMKRFNAVKIFFIDGSETKLLTEYKTFMPGLPHWTSNGEKVYLFDGKNLEVYESGLSSQSNKKDGNLNKIVYFKNNSIAVGNIFSSDFKFYEPIKNSEYLNLAISPNGSKIVFEVYGGNMYVMNSDGTGLIDIGKGYRPKWSFDSKNIVYMVTEDDGNNYTSSDIYTIKTDGTNKLKITETGDVLEMNPSWSPDGKYIAYHEMNEGAIYIIPVNIP